MVLSYLEPPQDFCHQGIVGAKACKTSSGIQEGATPHKRVIKTPDICQETVISTVLKAVQER
ncbi:MAG: hypothetical protein GY941_17965 [Planctomycetes bacterium]|nr:hypothetical protein [Planctomycetota bacterium]